MESESFQSNGLPDTGFCSLPFPESALHAVLAAFGQPRAQTAQGRWFSASETRHGPQMLSGMRKKARCLLGIPVHFRALAHHCVYGWQLHTLNGAAPVLPGYSYTSP